MKEFHERRRIRAFFHSRYAILALIVVALIITRGVWGVYGKYELSRSLAEKAQADYDGLKAREESLNRMNASLMTEAGKERELRDRFGMVREGEELIVLVEESRRAPVPVPEQKKSFWQRFFGFFGF